MEFQSAMMDHQFADFAQIVRNGTYYFPATRHYPNGSNVVCDRCARTNLPASIGYGNQDLCLNCAEKITNQMGSGGFAFPPIRRLDQVGGFPPPRRDPFPTGFPCGDDHLNDPPRFATRMEFGAAFPVTNMQVGSACPKKPSNSVVVTYMQPSHAHPDRK